jgi:tetratricopeptide (TPR) repeat protein
MRHGTRRRRHRGELARDPAGDVKSCRRSTVSGRVTLAAVMAVILVAAAAAITRLRWAPPAPDFPEHFRSTTSGPRAPFPQARGDRFAVAVASLAGATTGDLDRVASALEALGSVEVLRLGQTIARGPAALDSLSEGCERARPWLVESGVHVMICCGIKAPSEAGLPHLRWMAQTDLGSGGRWGRTSPSGSLELSELAWDELLQVLDVLVLSHRADFGPRLDRSAVEQLGAALQEIRPLIYSGRHRPGPRASVLANLRPMFAYALTVLGERSARDGALREAVTIYREWLSEHLEAASAMERGMVRNNLGNALAALGQLEPHANRRRQYLERAIAAYRSGALDLGRQRHPQHWAMLQTNLGDSLSALGERVPGTAQLQGAVAAYRDALSERDPEQTLARALTQFGLAKALHLLSNRNRDVTGLSEAIALYEAAVAGFDDDAAAERAAAEVALQTALLTAQQFAGP